MIRRCSGNGLMLAGLIVALVGLASVPAATLEIPRYWTPVLVGTALFLIGALRRRVVSSSGSGPDTIPE